MTPRATLEAAGWPVTQRNRDALGVHIPLRVRGAPARAGARGRGLQPPAADTPARGSRCRGGARGGMDLLPLARGADVLPLRLARVRHLSCGPSDQGTGVHGRCRQQGPGRRRACLVAFAAPISWEHEASVQDLLQRTETVQQVGTSPRGINGCLGGQPFQGDDWMLLMLRLRTFCAADSSLTYSQQQSDQDRIAIDRLKIRWLGRIR